MHGWIISVGLVAALAGCGALDRARPDAPPAVAVTLDPGDSVTHPQARPGAMPPAAIPAPPAPAENGSLGETLAGLGAPGEPGFWLRTGLVAAVAPGRVVTASDQSLAVELRPSGAAPSAGSQISLQAMQALGLPLGQLTMLRVFAD